MTEKLTYEAGMSELESIVSAMEKGEMSLEDSFKAFERGVELSEMLKKILDEGDGRIRELTSSGDVPFGEEQV